MATFQYPVNISGNLTSYFNFVNDDMLIVTDISENQQNLKETNVDIDEVVQLDEIQTITNKTIEGGNY